MVSLGAWLSRADSATGRALMLGLAVSLAVAAVSRVGALAGWETRAVDFFLFFRERVPTPSLVLVLIDEDAFQEMGERQPLSRKYLSELGEFLLQSGARVVAFDVHPRTPSDPAEDRELVALTQRWAHAPASRVVFTMVATPVRGDPRRYAATAPYSPDLHALFGFANVPVGPDGVVRRARPVLPAASGAYLPSFALATLAATEHDSEAALARALGSTGRVVLPAADPTGTLASEAVSLPMLAQDVWRIDFAGPPGSFVSFPAGAIMRLSRSGVAPAADNPFRDRIVIVGATFLESRDFYPTPVGLMAGVEIHANIVHTLLSRRALQPPHWALNLALMAAGCLCMAVLSTRVRGVWLVLLSALVVVVFVGVSYEAYRRGYWLDFVAPLAVMLSYRHVARLLARRRLRHAFGEFVSPDVMARVLRDGARVGSGEMRDVSVLVSDVRGFTALSEMLPAERVSETMNEYFAAMVEVILAHRGMVQDFIGDGMLAVFGAPADDPDHAWHAAQTALGMQRALRELNARWAAGGRPTLAMGVAVNTGRAFAGTMGAPRKKKYTVLGDVVNTTSRMEGQNRDLGTEILVSAAVLDAVWDRVRVRELGAVKVRGKAEPILLFELLGTR